MLLILTHLLLQYLGIGASVILEPAACESYAVLESSSCLGCVKDQILHLLPSIVGGLSTDNTDQFRELLPSHPKLTVQGGRGEVLGEPFGRVKNVTGSGDQLLARPVPSHAVQFLAHPPSPDIRFLIPAMRKHDGGSSTLIAGVVGAGEGALR